jgi:hypothetical protein
MRTYPPATTTTDSPSWGSGQPPWMLTRTTATPPDANRGRDRHPKEPGMLDVVGFDAAAPKLIADFSVGRV